MWSSLLPTAKSYVGVLKPLRLKLAHNAPVHQSSDYVKAGRCWQQPRTCPCISGTQTAHALSCLCCLPELPSGASLPCWFCCLEYAVTEFSCDWLQLHWQEPSSSLSSNLQLSAVTDFSYSSNKAAAVSAAGITGLLARQTLLGWCKAQCSSMLSTPCIKATLEPVLGRDFTDTSHNLERPSVCCYRAVYSMRAHNVSTTLPLITLRPCDILQNSTAVGAPFKCQVDLQL